MQFEVFKLAPNLQRFRLRAAYAPYFDAVMSHLCGEVEGDFCCDIHKCLVLQYLPDCNILQAEQVNFYGLISGIIKIMGSCLVLHVRCFISLFSVTLNSAGPGTFTAPHFDQGCGPLHGMLMCEIISQSFQSKLPHGIFVA